MPRESSMRPFILKRIKKEKEIQMVKHEKMPNFTHNERKDIKTTFEYNFSSIRLAKIQKVDTFLARLQGRQML